MPTDYKAGALQILNMNPPPATGNHIVTIPPSGEVISVRNIFHWVASPEGRDALDAQTRLTLLELAARLV